MQRNSYMIIGEGFTALILIQCLGFIFIGHFLQIYFPAMPPITVNIISSSAISPLLASAYLCARTKVKPTIILNKQVVALTFAGVVLVYIVSLMYMYIFKESNFVSNLSSPNAFKYINLFWYVVWAPVTEEILFRGYFLNVLSARGNVTASIVSSLLFAAAHILFAYPHFDIIMALESSFLFVYSMIFAFMYVQGGIIPAILTHIFSNWCSLFLINN